MSARYDVVRQIGEGGMGRVYEAVQRPSNRVVAIKTIRSELAISSSQRLLLNEAAAAAQVAHPNIVELLDVGRDEHRSMFLVMEYVEGASLERWSSTFPGLRAMFGAFDRILDALATAHAQGIVHGDLKPANVLRTTDGVVKLTDFGVAHVVDPLKLSGRRHVQGTPFYMAPEQLFDLGAIGPSTDLYAVGVMLYELVCEHEPFSAEGALTPMVTRKLEGPRPIVPRRGLDVSPALAALVTSLLDPNPRTRPRFAARVRDALAEIAARTTDASTPVMAPSDGPTVVDSTLAHARTISSSRELPPDTSQRELPFELPCSENAGRDVSLHTLRPLPLVGRRDQRERLRATVRDVVSTGRARCVLFSGRAGEGKTRLVRQGFADVEREGTMLGAAASFDETIANAQVGLRACIARLLGAPARTFDETLAGPWKWLERVPQPGVDLERAYDWLRFEERALDAKSAANVAAECLLAVGRLYPIYLWLDDVAWSRDGAMELVTWLLERSDPRVLVVGTLRSGTAEHPAVRAWLEAAVERGATHEVLGVLDVAERAALVSAAVPVSPEVADRFARRLEEPALLLVEAVRAWFDDGARESEIETASPASGLARRIATLIDGFGAARADAERVLFHAALLGVHFEERALRACGGVEAHVDAVLDRALLTGLLRVDGRAAYRFEHRMFLDAIALRGSARDDASAIRRATAAALVATYGRRDIEASLSAAKLARASGDAEAAIRLAAESVGASVRSSLFERAAEVIALIERWVAEDALPNDHIHRAILEAARGEFAYNKLDYPLAREHLGRALATFEKVGTRADVHAALSHMSSAYFYDDMFAEAKRCVDFVNEPIADPVCHARGHHRLAELAGMRDDLDEAIAHERITSELLVGEDAYFQFVVTINLVDFYVAAGRVDDAVAAISRARTNVGRISDRFLKQELEHSIAVIDAARGSFDAARTRARGWLEGLVQRGDRWQQTGACALVMLCTAAIGDEDAGASVHAFTEAYAKVAHDEAITWWCIRNAAMHLKARGKDDLAGELTGMFEARLARIRRAFAPQ